MAKQKTAFVCQECGYDSPAYLGKCPECGNWNSFKEVRLGSAGSSFSPSSPLQEIPQPQAFAFTKASDGVRVKSGFTEMDMVLGGGFVAGSVTLIAGDPGIGKSTLLLQLCLSLAQQGRKVLYVSAEESVEQVSMRASRIGSRQEDPNLFLLSITDTDAIVTTMQESKPDFVVIDSVQTVDSPNAGGFAGAVSQIRYATTQFVRVAKILRIPLIIVGHVTKEGMVAGPMVLSHMVDTVLFLEGEKFTTTRILRSLKNRFGPVDEVGVFLMEEKGMVEVKNPEQIFLANAKQNAPGSVLVVILEGTRPFLIEIQALVAYSKFPMPRRVAAGVDSRRVELLLAVLQKHCNIQLDSSDVFVNIAGGMRVSDPACDIGICLAIWSSLKNVVLTKIVSMGEVGLLGELRKVSQAEKRVREATKLGFSHVITAEKYKTVREVLQSLGGSEKGKSWQQTDKKRDKMSKENE